MTVALETLDGDQVALWFPWRALYVPHRATTIPMDKPYTLSPQMWDLRGPSRFIMDALLRR